MHALWILSPGRYPSHPISQNSIHTRESRPGLAPSPHPPTHSCVGWLGQEHCISTNPSSPISPVKPLPDLPNRAHPIAAVGAEFRAGPAPFPPSRLPQALRTSESGFLHGINSSISSSHSSRVPVLHRWLILPRTPHGRWSCHGIPQPWPALPHP